jgi:hypothetical protein
MLLDNVSQITGGAISVHERMIILTTWEVKHFYYYMIHKLEINDLSRE